MYTDGFVEELLKTVQHLAEENRRVNERLGEAERVLKGVRGEPIINLAKNLPPYPFDNVEEQKNWWNFVHEFLYALDGLYPDEKAKKQLEERVESLSFNRKRGRPRKE